MKPLRRLMPYQPLPASARKGPYAVERYRSVPGSVLLAGYDARGNILAELRVDATRYSKQLVGDFRRLLIKIDPQRLQLVE